MQYVLDFALAWKNWLYLFHEIIRKSQPLVDIFSTRNLFLKITFVAICSRFCTSLKNWLYLFQEIIRKSQPLVDIFSIRKLCLKTTLNRLKAEHYIKKPFMKCMVCNDKMVLITLSLVSCCFMNYIYFYCSLTKVFNQNY